MLNERAEAYRAAIRAANDKLHRAWDLNLPKGEVQALQETIRVAQLGLRKMGLGEERRPGTLMKPPRKARKPKAPPANEEAPAAVAADVREEAPAAVAADERAAST